MGEQRKEPHMRCPGFRAELCLEQEVGAATYMNGVKHVANMLQANKGFIYLWMRQSWLTPTFICYFDSCVCVLQIHSSYHWTDESPEGTERWQIWTHNGLPARERYTWLLIAKINMQHCSVLISDSLTDFWFVLFTLESDAAEKIILVPGSGQIINRDNLIK